MNARFLFLIVWGFGLFAAAPALAESTGSHWVSLERAFGVNYWQTSEGPEEGSSFLEPIKTVYNRSGTSFGFGVLTNAATAYSVPRLAYDYRLPIGFTFGLAGGIDHSTRSTTSIDQKGITETRTGTSKTILLAAPRIGWQWSLSERAVFWLRGGITYYAIISHSPAVVSQYVTLKESETTTAGLAGTIEPGLVILLAEHIALLLCATVDAPLTGNSRYVSDKGVLDSPTTMLNVGLQAGMTGRF